MRRKRGRRSAIVASSLLAVGCKEPAQPAAPPPANVVAKADQASRLWRDPVTADRFARRVLYTWTTAEQVEALRHDRRLLVREESPDRGASFYEQFVHALALRGDAIANLLDTTTYAKSRYAWPAPWATREGWPGESYGDHLIRVALRSNAIVLSLSTETGAFGARDLDGALVPLAEVQAHPDRIAAVYFEHVPGRGPLYMPAPSNAYREYVLCNEAMIATWSVGTQDIADELSAEIGALLAFAHDLDTDPAHLEDNRRAFAQALAFHNPLYAIEARTIERIAAHLRATPKPDAIEGGGNVAFPGIGPARTPPTVKPQPRGTYSSFAHGTH